MKQEEKIKESRFYPNSVKILCETCNKIRRFILTENGYVCSVCGKQ